MKFSRTNVICSLLICAGAVLCSGEESKGRLEGTGRSLHVFFPEQKNLGCEQFRSCSCAEQVIVSQLSEAVEQLQKREGLAVSHLQPCVLICEYK